MLLLKLPHNLFKLSPCRGSHNRTRSEGTSSNFANFIIFRNFSSNLTSLSFCLIFHFHSLLISIFLPIIYQNLDQLLHCIVVCFRLGVRFVQTEGIWYRRLTAFCFNQRRRRRSLRRKQFSLLKMLPIQRERVHIFLYFNTF